MASDPLDVLLEHLKRSRGFDFTGYKRSTLQRRIAKRMDAVGASNYLEYLDHLEVSPGEWSALFDTILINVTGFFRDAPAWEYFAAEIVPRLLESIGENAPLRVWCAGCASGEETYTMAMVLAEMLGEQAYLERVKVYATDVDEDALNQARHAIYTPKQVAGIPPEQLERYFDRADQHYTFRKDLRRTVIFGRNDLVQDAPISRIDLLVCRNTLMYFNAETQSRILSRFHFALNDWGYLFLGKSEMLITHSELFKPINLSRRVFTKVGKATVRDRLVFVGQGAGNGEVTGRDVSVSEASFEAAPVAQIVVDASGVLVLANREARTLFRIAPSDVGSPLKDLELSYRPVELRSHLEIVQRELRPLALGSVDYATVDGQVRNLDVQITPLLSGNDALGAAVAFQDVTRQHHLQTDLETSRTELEHAYEELQSTVEELETTNEELQSTNEELETTNEELQSTNEELETMNEELQSTNEELETINDELRQRTLELNDVNAFLETILKSMGFGVAVVDRNLAVQVWNEHAVELWGLRRDEAEGHNILGLDIGLPVGDLKSALQGCLTHADGRFEQLMEATNRRGRTIKCRVTCMPLSASDDGAAGAILLMEQVD
jgi:two-component system CheB/CheR fusion protein